MSEAQGQCTLFLPVAPSFFHSISLFRSYWVKVCNSPVLMAVVSPHKTHPFIHSKIKYAKFLWYFLKAVFFSETLYGVDDAEDWSGQL